jgi:hypothetical protein
LDGSRSCQSFPDEFQHLLTICSSAFPLWISLYTPQKDEHTLEADNMAKGRLQIKRFSPPSETGATYQITF